MEATYSEITSALMALWEEEVGGSSSLFERFHHPAFKAVIALGERAVPTILRSLKEKPSHWSYALGKIAADEAPAAFEGTLEEACREWVAFWERRGFGSEAGGDE